MLLEYLALRAQILGRSLTSMAIFGTLSWAVLIHLSDNPDFGGMAWVIGVLICLTAAGEMGISMASIVLLLTRNDRVTGLIVAITSYIAFFAIFLLTYREFAYEYVTGLIANMPLG